MSTSNFSLSGPALRQLQELAQWASTSPAEALEQAVRDQYDRKFWEAVNAGYAALRADAPAWAEVEAERRIWENTLRDGLDSTECRAADGDLPPPADPGLAS